MELSRLVQLSDSGWDLPTYAQEMVYDYHTEHEYLSDIPGILTFTVTLSAVETDMDTDTSANKIKREKKPKQ